MVGGTGPEGFRVSVPPSSKVSFQVKVAFRVAKALGGVDASRTHSNTHTHTHAGTEREDIQTDDTEQAVLGQPHACAFSGHSPVCLWLPPQHREGLIPLEAARVARRRKGGSSGPVWLL